MMSEKEKAFRWATIKLIGNVEQITASGTRMLDRVLDEDVNTCFEVLNSLLERIEKLRDDANGSDDVIGLMIANFAMNGMGRCLEQCCMSQIEAFEDSRLMKKDPENE